MKFYALSAGLCLSLGVATAANAQIVQGNMDAYFTTVYATDLAGKTRTPQYDSACNSKYWYLANTRFYVDYRVNTDAATHTAFFNYANAEHTLAGVLDKTSGNYSFKTDQVSQQLKDMHAKALYFTLTGDFRWGSAQVAFEGVEAPKDHTHADTHSMSTMDDPNCPCDCHKQGVATYQCVLST